MKRRGWLVMLSMLALLFLLPFLALLSGLFSASSSWHHISTTVLPRYIGSSLFLLFFSVTGAYLLGTGTAWIMSRYTFPGKPLIEIALIFPHAVPVYISAFAYRGLFGYGGVLDPLISDFAGPWAAVFLFIFGLYTYVYLAARASLSTFGGHYIDTAVMLGKSEGELFFKVALPLMRPAAVGGAVLAGVEVLNEYGALRYLGVESFTTGIFRAWFSLGDITAAIRLSLFLLLTVGFLLALEKMQRGRAGYSASGRNPSPLLPRRAGGIRGLLLAGLLLLPILFGFALPVLQLLMWTADAPLLRQWGELALVTAGTLGLTFTATLLAVFTALLLAYIPLLFQRGLPGTLASLPSLGYAVPGAVIAMGIMRLSTSADFALNNIAGSLKLTPPGLIFSGSLAVLTGAYLIRFIAVSYKPIIGSLYIDSGATMGRGPLHLFFTVYLPLMKRPAIFAGILFFLDAIKELPLTIILRPFNYDTLATITYNLASDEKLKEAAPFGLILSALGVLVTTIAMTLSKRKRRRT
jgi:iron(III) transport system permease protein